MPPRILLSELYTLKDKKEHAKYQTFDKIIEICHKKIKNTATIGGMNIFYEIPYYMYGKPLYKIADCIEYIVSALRNIQFILETQGCSLDSAMIVILKSIIKNYPDKIK